MVDNRKWDETECNKIIAASYCNAKYIKFNLKFDFHQRSLNYSRRFALFRRCVFCHCEIFTRARNQRERDSCGTRNMGYIELCGSREEIDDRDSAAFRARIQIRPHITVDVCLTCRTWHVAIRRSGVFSIGIFPFVGRGGGGGEERAGAESGRNQTGMSHMSMALRSIGIPEILFAITRDSSGAITCPIRAGFVGAVF